MSEGRRAEINASPDMEGNYPDSVSSSPRSRETDSDYFGGSSNQRWEAVDPGGSSTGSSARVRLMCSCGGKILPRPHDNQLAYVGGDTRILAVDRSIRFSTMISKLSNLWGSGVSFKYQLPNEDLDALVSVTNDEDLDNMMAEYDRLQKSGYKNSRLRIFVFPKRPADGSTSSLGSVLEECKREQWFVEALNNPPVNQGVSNRSEGGSASEASAWVNNMPDYLFGLEHGNNNGGMEEDRKQAPPQVQSSRNSLDSEAGRLGTNPGPRIETQIGISPVSSDQAEKSGRNLNWGFEDNSGGGNRVISAPIQEIAIPVSPRPNFQQQQQQEYSAPADAGNRRRKDVNLADDDNHRAPPQQPHQQLPPQFPVQEFHNMHIKQQQRDSIPRAGDDINTNSPGRKLYPDQPRVMNLAGPGQEVYMQQPSRADYYRQDQQHQQQQATGHLMQQPVTYWQMHEHGGNGQYPVYMVPPGANMMPAMTAVRPAPGYYNPVQRVNAAPAAYDAPMATVRATAGVQRQQQLAGGVSDVAADPYRDQQQQQQQQQPVSPVLAAPVSKVTTVYGTPATSPTTGDVRMGYRATAAVPSMPVGMPHPESYPYPQQHVVYDPNMNANRQVYYQYQPMAPITNDVNVSPSLESAAAATAAATAATAAAGGSEQQAKFARVSPPP